MGLGPTFVGLDPHLWVPPHTYGSQPPPTYGSQLPHPPHLWVQPPTYGSQPHTWGAHPPLMGLSPTHAMTLGGSGAGGGRAQRRSGSIAGPKKWGTSWGEGGGTSWGARPPSAPQVPPSAPHLTPKCPPCPISAPQVPPCPISAPSAP